MSKRNNAVLVSEDDWKAIQETLYLLSIPGMRQSIREGMETPVDGCAERTRAGEGVEQRIVKVLRLWSHYE